MNEIILKNNEKAATCHAAITEHRRSQSLFQRVERRYKTQKNQEESKEISIGGIL